MNKIYLLISALFLSFVQTTIAQHTTAVSIGKANIPIDGIFQADPTVFFYGGYYYLYGTNGDSEEQQGFKVYQSTDLKHWKVPAGTTSGFALLKGDAFGSTGFWAPQVWFEKGKFYMAYTADEHIAIAVSDSPVGPFKQTSKAPLEVGQK